MGGLSRQLTGVDSPLAEACFQQLSKLDQQIYFDVALQEQLQWMHMTYNSSYLKGKARNVNTITMSGLYTAIRVMPLFLIAIKLSEVMIAFILLRLLSRLILLNHWWPNLQIHGVKDVEDIYRSHLCMHHPDMQEHAKHQIFTTARLG